VSKCRLLRIREGVNRCKTLLQGERDDVDDGYSEKRMGGAAT